MATIVTRSGKGSPLTNTEVDANFTNLNSDKLELSGGTMTGNLVVPNLSITSTNWFGFGDYGERISGSNAASKLFFYTDATLALTLEDTQDATFAGKITATAAGTNSSLYALDLSRSGSGSSPDIWADSNNLVLGTSASTAVLTLLNSNATFAGDVSIPVGNKLYLGGGSHTYISEDIDDRVRFFAGGTEFLRFTEDSSDITNLYTDMNIAGGLEIAHSSDNGFKVTANDTVANTPFAAMRLDYNASGSDTLTTDRAHIGLEIDVDSSASGGDTSNEHRLYGVWTHTKATGDSDLVYGGYFQGEAEQTAGTITSVFGVYGRADSDPAAGTVSSAYGVYGYAPIQNASGTGVTNAFGVYGKTLLQQANVADVAQLIGGYFEVELSDPLSGSVEINTIYAVRAEIDNNDEDTVHLDIDNTESYLYYGNYAGTQPGNAYGVYIVDDVPSYFGGSVGLGTSGPTETLTVDGDTNVTGQMYIGPNNADRRPFAKKSNWGYSSSYKAIILGSTSTAPGTEVEGATTISFGYDPSTNSDGSFSGDGREILFRNGQTFVTPNSANDDFNQYHLVLKDGNVGIGAASPSSLLHLSAAASPTLRIVDTTNDCTLLAYAQDSEAIVGTYSNHNLGLFTNSTRAVTIDTSQNATFAGAATATALTISASAGKLAFANDAANYYIHQKDTTDGILLSGYYGVSLGHQGAKKLQVDSAGVDITGDATVSGDVTFDSGKKIGLELVGEAEATVGPGWMTVAAYTSGRQHGEIIVTDADSGDHGFIRIDWLHSYADSNFTVLNTGGHSNRITGCRVLYQTSNITYGTYVLQVYVTVESTYEVSVYHHHGTTDYGQFTVQTPVIADTITGYAVHGNQIEGLDSYSFASEEGIQAGGSCLINGRMSLKEGGEPYAYGTLLLEANSSSRQIRISPPSDSANGYIDYRGGNLLFKDDGSETMRFAGGGNIVIGHSTVESSIWSITPRLQIEGNNASTSSMSIVRNSESASGPYLVLSKTRGGVTGTEVIVQDDDNLGSIRWSGADGTDRASQAAAIDCLVDGAPGTGDMPARLVFSTTQDGNEDPTVALTLNSSQEATFASKVFVGTSEQIEIQSADGSGNTAIQIEALTGKSAYIDLGGADSGDYAARIITDQTNSTIHSTGVLLLAPASSSVDLQYANATKLQTSLKGITVTGRAEGFHHPINTDRNFAIGDGTGDNFAAGAYRNMLIGYHAGQNITTGDQNTFIGYDAGINAKTSSLSTAVGYQAGAGVSTGTDGAAAEPSSGITAVGYRAGYQSEDEAANGTYIGREAGHGITTGYQNTAVGAYALHDIAGAHRNAAFGYIAGQKLDGNAGYNTLLGGYVMSTATESSNCVAVGYLALRGHTTSTPGTGDNNVAIGQQAMYYYTTGQHNVSVGHHSGFNLTTGSHNVFMGYYAGNDMLRASNNIAIGSVALDEAQYDHSNVAVGYGTLTHQRVYADHASQDHTYNVAVGHEAGYELTTGVYNTFLGAKSGNHIEGGTNNTLLGWGAGNDLTSGDYNICIGRSTIGGAADSHYRFTIGYNISCSEDSQVTIGRDGAVIRNEFDTDAAWTQSSDVRKKRNIQTDTLGLDFINELRPVTFQWKPSNEHPKSLESYSETNTMNLDATIHGLIAQEVKEAMDKVGAPTTFSGWKEDPDGSQSISREMMVTPLINAVKELSSLVKTLQAEVEELKKK